MVVSPKTPNSMTGTKPTSKTMHLSPMGLRRDLRAKDQADIICILSVCVRASEVVHIPDGGMKGMFAHKGKGKDDRQASNRYFKNYRPQDSEESMSLLSKIFFADEYHHTLVTLTMASYSSKVGTVLYLTRL